MANNTESANNFERDFEQLSLFEIEVEESKTIYNYSDYEGEDISEMDQIEDVNDLSHDVKELIKRHAKASYRRKADGMNVVVAGILGLWSGRTFGYKVKPYNEFELFSAGYDHTIKVDHNGELEILLHHHDGTHYLNIYVLDEEQPIHDLTIDEVANLVDNEIPPVHVDKQFADAYGIRYIEEFSNETLN